MIDSAFIQRERTNQWNISNIPAHNHSTDTLRVSYNDLLDQPGTLTVYDVTIGSPVIGIVEQNLLSFDIGGGTVVDGDILTINYTNVFQNNNGTPTNLTLKLYYGSASTALFNGTSPNSATIYKNIFQILTQRAGNDLYVFTSSSAQNDPFSQIYQTPNSANAVAITPDFATTQTVKITAVWSNVGAGAIGVTPVSGKAYKI